LVSSSTEALQPKLAFASSRGRWVLTATILGSGVASLDATVVGIALPHIGKDFHAAVASLQWVVAAYTLTLAAFLLLGGSLGDRMGRRRIFEFGVAWFAIASLGCAVAPNVEVLIAARALQGIGGALLTPGSLAILQASFSTEDRARAIGAWAGFGGLAGAAGPLVGGYLLDVASWRWVFVINLPLSFAVLAISRRYVPESADASNDGRIDSLGALWAVLALAGLTYGLIEGPSDGWHSAAIVTVLAVGVFAVGAFIVTELRTRNPLVPPRMFIARQFATTNAVTLLVYAGLGGTFFLLPIVLQQVAGYSPLESGLALLPITVMMLFLSARSGKLAARIGPRLQMTLGPAAAGVGLLLLTRCVHDHNYFSGVLPGALVLGTGLVLTVAPLTSTAMSSAPSAHAGVASAVNNDVARVGGLLAVAVLPVVSSITGDAYLHPAALGSGYEKAGLICAVLCWIGAVVAGIWISNSDFVAPDVTAADPRLARG
jgi:EmrB/QacA subfamily drug resistance transporter